MNSEVVMDLDSRELMLNGLKIEWIKISYAKNAWFVRHPMREHIIGFIEELNGRYSIVPEVYATVTIESPEHVIVDDLAADGKPCYFVTNAFLKKRGFETVEAAKDWVSEIFLCLVT